MPPADVPERVADVMPRSALRPHVEAQPIPDAGDVWATARYDLSQMVNIAGDVDILEGSRLEHIGQQGECEYYRVILARPDFAGFASRRLISPVRKTLQVALGGLRVLVTIDPPELSTVEEADHQLIYAGNGA